ncbi:MAG: DoxX family protein [Bryobacterales bacterium]|nr:DoxX family protein [Bryobacterales bacterium]
MIAAAQLDGPSVRIFWLKLCLASGLTVGFVLSWKLWLSSRFYPLTPISEVLTPLRHPLDYCLFGACFILLVLIIASSTPSKLIATFALLAILLAILDQSRWQPWFYQYMLMFISVGLAYRTGRSAELQNACLNTCRLIVVSVYVWSGIQKANPGFIHDLFPWLLDPVTRFLPASVASLVARSGVVAPIAECGIGILLVTRAHRDIAVISALLMHAVILVEIGPFGHDTNSTVWFWNMTMAGFVFVLFWHSPDFSAGDLLWHRGSSFQKLVLVLCVLAPFLSLFHRWDNYLSWALYAGNKDVAQLYLSDAVEERLPDEIREYVAEDPKHGNVLSIDRWSAGELNVPPYPEQRIYKNIARRICGYASKPNDVILVVQSKLTLLNRGSQSQYDCSGLQRQ